jgi:predicted ATPase
LRTSPSRFAFLTQVQLGVGAGMMRVGAYGSSTRRTYGVLGDATNLAARLMMDAEPGQILVSARVAELIQPHYRVEALGERQFKGKRQKQLVFAVIGQNSPTLIQLDALYRTPPLGRDARTGGDHRRRQSGGNWRRPAHSARRRGRRRQEPSCRGDGAPGRRSGLFRALWRVPERRATILRRAAHPACRAAGVGRTQRGVPHRAGHTSAGDRCRHRTGLAGASPLAGRICSACRLPTTRPRQTFDPRLRREALGSLVVSLFLHYARQRPLFLLLEDVHWLDEADQVIVLALCRALADWPLVICLLHHPMNPLDTPFVTALDTVQRQLHLHLGELTAQATAALVAQRLQGTVEPLVAALVFAQTQGNPFFAEELTDALRERAAPFSRMARSGGRRAACSRHCTKRTRSNARRRFHWRLRADARLDAVTLGLPDTVHGLVLARLDLLTEETRLTVKVASVIGRVFETRVLAAAHPRAPGMTALQQQIAELEARDFARIEAPPPHPAYIFKHNITQEAIYHTLLESQRQELHLAVASVLERTAPAAVERLAHHYSQADITQAPTRARALFYLDAAAWRAKRSYANETALAYFERALALETRWEWLRSKCEVLHILGQRLQEEATLLVLEADPAADQTIVAELWAEFHEATSQFPAARADLQQALDAYAAQADQRNQARVLARLGEIVLREGDGDEAEQIYRQALSLLADASDEGSRPEIPLPHGRGSTGGVPRPSPLAPPTIRAQVLLGLGVVMRQRGEYDAAAAMLTEALNLYAAQENQPEVATALTRLGGVAFLRRDFGAARTAWQQALTIRRAIGDREGEGSSLLNIAQVYTSLGDYGAALPLLRQALDIQRAVGNRWWENAVWNALGIVALAVGDYAEARRCITQAEALCLAVGDEAGAAIMTFNLAQVDRACGDFAAALARLTRSRQWAQENDDPEFAAQCLTELALTAQAAGQLEIAEQHADAALHLYRTLEMYAAQSTDLATLALVQLARGARQQAHATAQQLLEIIDASAPHQIEYPQRDLYVAALAAAACGDTAGAAELLQRAYTLIQTHAADISDAALRQSFLENVAINRVVVAAMGSAPLRVG